MCTRCFIVPGQVLRKLAEDPRFPSSERRNLVRQADHADLIARTRALETEKTLAVAAFALAPVTVAAAPSILAFDCRHTMTLPGTPVPNPTSASDPTVKRAAVEASRVVDFYKQVFQRNSIDGAGMSVLSSVHYGSGYNNAFWNGTQMAYGDGDGSIFVDFTLGNDVIGHELTHGVTQHSLQLAYMNEAGGLNESMSDVFGSMFRQWEAKQDAHHADWLIGSNILGPSAKAHGYTCLRDLSNPAATHCLSQQPVQFSGYHDGMDPHLSSGIPNFAFYKAAMAIGGKSWEKTGQIWYKALTTSGSRPSCKMKEFADLTRHLAQTLYPADRSVFTGVDAAWRAVGL